MKKNDPFGGKIAFYSKRDVMKSKIICKGEITSQTHAKRVSRTSGVPSDLFSVSLARDFTLAHDFCLHNAINAIQGKLPDARLTCLA